MDAIPLYLRLALIVLLIAGNAFFVGSEIAISSARRSRIRQLAEHHDKRAARVLMLHREPERFYSVTQVGITLVSLGLGAVGMQTMDVVIEPWFVSLAAWLGGGEAVLHAAHTASWVVAFALVSFVHVVAGELAPKVLAFHKAEQLSLAVGGTINLLYLTFRPLIYVMKLASDALLWLVGQRDLTGQGESYFAMSVEEIQMILAASEKDGMLPPEESEMIRGVFQLDEHSVREAMIPRTQIRALEQDETLAAALRYFRDIPHARFPVYDKSLDRITGVVAIKELLTALAESSEDDLGCISRKPVRGFAKPPFVVPNSKLQSELLKDFKRLRQQMAIVIDEYGGTEGIISLEDILEEIVGDYEDEFTSQARRRVRKLDDRQYEIDASMRVTDLEPLLGFPFPVDDDYVTLSGLFYKRLGSVPKVGDSVLLDGARLTVLEMDNHRITLFKFEAPAVGEDGLVRPADSSSAADAGLASSKPARPSPPASASGAD